MIMKMTRKIFCLAAALTMTVLLTQIRVCAQVTLTVSPSIVSNTYPGFITLNITGLTNTEKVTIQKWLDLNGNGVIDPGEPLIDTFQLKDNYNAYAVIGNATNINMPFDTNPAGGVITTTLNFLPPPLENTVGQEIYRVVSPTGHFAPVSALFDVTNSAFGQSISGTIYTNGVPCPNGVVVVQDQSLNNPVAATVADSNGHYFLPLPASSYDLIAGYPNFHYDFSTGVSLVLTNGQAATNSLYLTNNFATAVTISGGVFDASSSNGIGGLLMQLQSGSSFQILFTDTNGNYSASVQPNFWTISPSKERLTRRAYVVSGATFQVNATTGSVANANIYYPQGTALFYGKVINSSNTPLGNVEVDGSNNSTNAATSYSSKGYTDLNGNYAVAVLGDLTNQWAAQITEPIGNYIVNVYQNIPLSPNQAVEEDFTPLSATATISGNVRDNSGNNVVGVTLTGSATISGKNYQSLDATTDNSGNYSMAVGNGQWNLQFLEGGSQDNLDTLGYEDPTAPHIVNVPPASNLLNIVVYPLGTPVISDEQFVGPGQFRFLVTGTNNVSYTVQVATNLLKGGWANVYSFQMTTNGLVVTDPSATNKMRFYRIQKN
jgi:hypothetical protein